MLHLRELEVTSSHYAESHFNDCVGKEREPRTFYREDQLAQHIKGVRLVNDCNKNVPRTLLSSWRVPNSCIDCFAFICGLCRLNS